MNKVLLLAAIASVSLMGCGKSADSDKQFTNCVSNGVTYFKEIGSYPTLKSDPNQGRSAEEVANERCMNSLRAFD